MTSFHTYPPQRLYEYWLSLPKQGLLPPRSAVNPADIKDIIPYVTIFEWRPPDEYRYRLAGTKIVARLGFEPTGRNYFDFIPAEAKPRLIETVTALVNTPCGMRSVRKEFYEKGFDRLVEHAAFPIGNPNGGAPLVIGATSQLESARYSSELGPRLPHSNPAEFEYIDIGAGVSELREVT